MSIETDPRQGADTPPEPTEDHLARSVMAKAAWGQRVLSPWVQRQLDAGGGSQANATPGHSPVALTLSGTRSLLGRLQRATDKGRIWRPDVGSLNPLLVNNFTQSIVHRFAETPSARAYPTAGAQAQDTGAAHIDETELPLAGVKSEALPEPVAQSQAPALPFTLEEVRRALENSGSSQRGGTPSAGTSPARTHSTAGTQAPVQREPDKPAGALPFSLAEVRAALEKPHFTQAAERPVQRTTDQPISSPSQPDRGTPSRRRILSRVEEVTPTAGESAAGRGLSEPAAGDPEALPPPDISPTPPQVQRQIDTPKSSMEPAKAPPARTQETQEEPPDAPPVEPTVVEVIPFPTRPRRERPTIIPAIQRQAAPGADTPPASKAAGESAGQAESPEPAKSSPGAARTAPAETGHTGQFRPETGSEATVQRQPDLELPLRDLPAPLAAAETPTPEETGLAASPLAPVQAQPPTGARQASKPVVQRHPESELLLRKAEEDATSAAESSSQEIPVVQRQPDLEMPLKETPVVPTPAETPSTPSVEAGLLQRHEEAATQPGDNIPAAKPDPQETSTVQRQPDLELPLKERAAASIPAETPSSPPAQSAEAAPVQRREEATAKIGHSSLTPVVKPDPQETPAIQRQPDLEMPLKEPSAPSVPAETPSVPSAQLAETAPLQRQEEVATITDDSPELPVVKPALQETPVVQRQPELEMPLKEPPAASTPAETPAQPAEAVLLQRQEEAAAKTGDSPGMPVVKPDSQETPAIQRQPDLEMPLREPSLPSASAETPSAQPAEAAILQRQEAAAAKPGDQPGTPVVKPDLQETRVAQRQPDLEMPLKEPSVSSTIPVETPSAQPAEAATLQRQEETAAKTSDSPLTPVVKPDLQETPIVQRHPDLGMPLKEMPAASIPTETPTQPAETAPLQRREEVAAGTGDSPGIPATKPGPQEIPAVQRHLDQEMPLREPSAPSVPAETPSVPSAQLAETAPLQRQEAAATIVDDSPEMPVVKPALQETPAVQRQPELEMPLKETPAASTPAETPSSPSAQPIEAAPVQRREEAAAKISDSPGMPVVKPDLQEAPVVQRQPDLEMPLKEPVSTPISLEKGMAEVAGPGPDQEIPAPRPADSVAAPAVQRVKPGVQRQADQALDLPLRQPPLPAAESLPAGGAPETDLNQDILARARASSDLPLLKPLPAPRSSMTQAKPDRPIGVLPQARPEGTGRVSPGSQAQTEVPASPPMPALPLATPRWGEAAQPATSEQPLRLPGASSAPATIQRQPDLVSPPADVITMAASPDIIQRVETETTAPPNGKSEAKSSSSADVEKLARQILPEIKRMLARERDRRGR